MGILLKSLGLAALAGDPTEPTEPSGATVTVPLRSDRPAVTLRSALSLPAAFRAIQITAGMAGDLTLDVWRGGVKIATPSLVAQPDPWRQLSSWIERVVVDLAGDGNAFLRITRTPAGEVVALTVLDPFLVTVRRDRKGRKFYDVNDGTGRITRLKASEVIHLWGLEVPGADRGLGPIGHCRASIEGALDTRNYASAVFQDGRISPGNLYSDKPLDVATQREYKRVWREHDPADPRVFGHGLKYEPVAISPKDAQWLDAQNFGVLDIARMFGVPAPYLEVGVDGDAMTYQNLQQVDAKFLRTTLFPVYLRKIEAALTEVLPRGQRARFDVTPLQRPDAKSRMEVHAIAIANRIYGPEYARRVEEIDETDAPAREDAPAA